MNWDRLLVLLKDPRVRARLLRISRAILVDHGHAEDALQDAALSVVARFRRLTVPAEMTTDQIQNYLAVAVRNRARDQRRAQTVPGRALVAVPSKSEPEDPEGDPPPEPADPISDAKIRSAWQRFPEPMKCIFVGPSDGEESNESNGTTGQVNPCDKENAREQFRKLLALEEQVPFCHVVRSYWDRVGALVFEKRSADTAGPNNQSDLLEEWTYVCVLLYAWGRSWFETARLPIKTQIDAPLRWICGLIKLELQLLERYRGTAEQFYPLVRDLEDPGDDGC